VCVFTCVVVCVCVCVCVCVFVCVCACVCVCVFTYVGACEGKLLHFFTSTSDVGLCVNLCVSLGCLCQLDHSNSFFFQVGDRALGYPTGEDIWASFN
jgi:hypothetical protein